MSAIFALSPDTLVEFVDAQTDENATIIAETVSGAEVLDIILEAVRKNSNTAEALTEAQENIENIEIELMEEDDEMASVTLLSVVTNTLTEMLGEEAVEALPAEMVFDIVEEAKELDLSDDAADMDLVELVEEISTELETAINEGTIDLDSEDYEGETLEEFLNDYEDTEDLLEEMSEVNEEILSESEDEAGADLMRKAKEATTLVEAKKKKYPRCPRGDFKCIVGKAKKAKKQFAKDGGMKVTGKGGKTEIKPVTMDSISGKLRKHVKETAKRFKKFHGKAMSDDILAYTIAGIIKRMRFKGKKLKK